MADKLTQNLSVATVVDTTNDRIPIYSAASPSELSAMAPNNLIPDASTTVEGKVELATDAETITGTDTVRAITPSNYKNAFDETLPAVTTAATSKTTPVDADELPIVDSAASNVLKKLTWANLKATLLTWLRLATTIIPVNAPQGFLINGKISVTDTAGITVAIKTLAGTDPSATDPVYVRIGDTVRTISSALLKALADGVNYMNAGSAELATKEVDYFIYLGYNATDGVVIGFSRYPGACQYSDFSATTTHEKYAAISTITTAANTDYYEVVGRFAATLSAGAGYTWTVPTYTAINLIQRPIYETRWLTYLGAITSGSGSPTTVTHNKEVYKITGRKIELVSDLTITDKGTAASTVVSTMPFTHNNSTIITFGGRESGATGKLIAATLSGTVNNFNTFGTLNDTLWVNTYRIPVYLTFEI